ncbi:MAG: hypothetical protein WD894_26580 [Pirellulales bacterium]
MTTEAANGAAPKKKVGPKPLKNKAAVALGKLGGRKGGLARAKNLSADERTAIAKKAAKARWKKQRKKQTTSGR